MKKITGKFQKHYELSSETRQDGGYLEKRFLGDKIG